MIITDRFVYLHLGKTGGTFVELVMERLHQVPKGLYYNTVRPDHQATFGNYDQHECYTDLAPEYRDRPVLSTIRDPFDWYVSLYEFGWWKTHPGTLFDDARMADLYPSYPDLSFPEFIGAITDFRPGVLHPVGINRSSPGPFADADVGYYTYLFVFSLFADPAGVLGQPGLRDRDDPAWGEMPRTRFVTTCNLNRGLHEFLLEMGYGADEVAFVPTLGRVNQTETRKASAGTWAEYYTPEMLSMIRRKDRLIFGMFPQFDPDRATTPDAQGPRGGRRGASALLPRSLRRLVGSRAARRWAARPGRVSRSS